MMRGKMRYSYDIYCLTKSKNGVYCNCPVDNPRPYLGRGATKRGYFINSYRRYVLAIVPCLSTIIFSICVLYTRFQNACSSKAADISLNTFRIRFSACPLQERNALSMAETVGVRFVFTSHTVPSIVQSAVRMSFNAPRNTTRAPLSANAFSAARLSFSSCVLLSYSAAMYPPRRPVYNLCILRSARVLRIAHYNTNKTIFLAA